MAGSGRPLKDIATRLEENYGHHPIEVEKHTSTQCGYKVRR